MHRVNAKKCEEKRAATDSSKPVTYTDFDGMKRVRCISQGYAEQLDGHKRPCDKQTERMRPLVAVTNWNSSPSEINVDVLCPMRRLHSSATRECRVAREKKITFEYILNEGTYIPYYLHIFNTKVRRHLLLLRRYLIIIIIITSLVRSFICNNYAHIIIKYLRIYYLRNKDRIVVITKVFNKPTF